MARKEIERFTDGRGNVRLTELTEYLKYLEQKKSYKSKLSYKSKYEIPISLIGKYVWFNDRLWKVIATFETKGILFLKHPRTGDIIEVHFSQIEPWRLRD